MTQSWMVGWLGSNSAASWPGALRGAIVGRTMRADTFWRVVTIDDSNLLDRLIEFLEALNIRYCVVGGQAVNAYVDPLVSLDLDLVVAADQIELLEQVLPESFRVERFPHSVNVSSPGSDLRVQFQTDPRYPPFVARSSDRPVLGRLLPVATLRDVLAGKVWAAMDPARRASKRQKDLADIARIIESFPELRAQVPDELLDRLI